jgi:hypothetical protein
MPMSPVQTLDTILKIGNVDLKKLNSKEIYKRIIVKNKLEPDDYPRVTKYIDPEPLNKKDLDIKTRNFQ